MNRHLMWKSEPPLPRVRHHGVVAGRRALAAAVLGLLVSLVASGCGASVLELDVGQCFDDPPDFAEVADVDVVPCASPHRNEVIAVVDITDSPYPGDAAIARAAESRCRAAFAGYVGIAYDDSPLALGWLAPSADSWAVGDREVICFVFDQSGNRTSGSVRGVSA